jgi:MATE family multidrug resistance protein
MAGSSWATTVALAGGVVASLAFFFSRTTHSVFKSRLPSWPHARRVARLWALGIPMGLAGAVDLLAFALFQMMQSKLGPVDGAATQIAMMLTSVAYMPAIGFGIAGTTFVGQSIGAGDRDWAARVGTAVIIFAVAYMGCVGLLIAALGPWLVPLFVASNDPHAAAVIRLACIILWIAACYQVFDGMNLGSSFCLRGAGDARVPAMLVLALGWFGFVPLAHILTFQAGEGWLDALPSVGWGAAGGWTAALAYSAMLGCTMLARWRSGAWRRIVLR